MNPVVFFKPLPHGHGVVQSYYSQRFASLRPSASPLDIPFVHHPQASQDIRHDHTALPSGQSSLWRPVMSHAPSASVSLPPISWYSSSFPFLYLWLVHGGSILAHSDISLFFMCRVGLYSCLSPKPKLCTQHPHEGFETATPS